MMRRVLIAGCGYVGSALARLLLEDGHRVWGLRRSRRELPPGVEPLVADLADPSTLGDLPGGLDAVVYAASADGRDEASYRRAYLEGPRNLLSALGVGAGAPGRFVFTSSTGVYGVDDGSRVDEDTPARPTLPRSKVLLEGEEAVRAAGIPTTVVRPGGIYGPGRDRLVRKVREGEVSCPPEPVFTNRIHRDDCAGILRHVLGMSAPEGLYLAVDREPAELCAVYRWLARELGVPEPEISEDGGRGRRSKRCSSGRIVRAGYAFRYPTFRQGYARVLANLGGRSAPKMPGGAA